MILSAREALLLPGLHRTVSACQYRFQQRFSRGLGLTVIVHFGGGKLSGNAASCRGVATVPTAKCYVGWNQVRR